VIDTEPTVVCTWPSIVSSSRCCRPGSPRGRQPLVPQRGGGGRIGTVRRVAEHADLGGIRHLVLPGSPLEPRLCLVIEMPGLRLCRQHEEHRQLATLTFPRPGF